MDYMEFAIQMELDGEAYYNELAEKNKENGLHTIFISLAKDESFHAETLRKKAAELPYELTQKSAVEEYQNIFQSTHDFKSKIKAAPEQIDGYRMALEKERESIELYEKMKAEAKDTETIKLFNYLIDQEKSHYKIFDELIAHLLHGKEWVEAAEFNNKEAY